MIKLKDCQKVTTAWPTPLDFGYKPRCKVFWVTYYIDTDSIPHRWLRVVKREPKIYGRIISIKPRL